jgi:hypothetical protein
MKSKKDLFDFVQGYTRAYFEYVLINVQVTDNEYIAQKYLELLEMFGDSKVEDKFMISFFLMALEEQFITGVHLDKLGIALQRLASTTIDKKIVSDIDWTMRHLDMVYTKFKKR